GAAAKDDVVAGGVPVLVSLVEGAGDVAGAAAADGGPEDGDRLAVPVLVPAGEGFAEFAFDVGVVGREDGEFEDVPRGGIMLSAGGDGTDEQHAQDERRAHPGPNK